MSASLRALIAELRAVSAAIGTPQLPRRTREDEVRWAAKLTAIATRLESLKGVIS